MKHKYLYSVNSICHPIFNPREVTDGERLALGISHSPDTQRLTSLSVYSSVIAYLSFLTT